MQYHLNKSRVIPLSRPYTIRGEEDDDTDQYDIVVLGVDEEKLDPTFFEEYPPYDLCESDALTIFNPMATYAIRAFPTYLRELSYEERSAKITSLSIDAIYEGRAGTTGMHTLRVNRADQIDQFDGMSGAPVFQVIHDGPRYSSVFFAGMLLRGSATAGTIQFLEHERIISALTKIIKGEVEPSQVQA